MSESNYTVQLPTATVIIPVYNGISTLPACLDSVGKQDYPQPPEVIIVDDGSTDGSGDYAESKGFKVIRQENRGPGVARNTGANAASGELLIFTDADCILDRDFITELTRPLIGTDIVGSQGIFYSRQRNLVARFIQQEINERYVRQSALKYIDWIATYGACYRKDVFLKNGGFNDIYSSEDAEFSIRLGKKGYKMVLAPRARCQHTNYENFFKFIRYKYKRAYWTVWLYSQYPNRIVSDKLTPSSRKNLMFMMMGMVIFLLLGVFWKSSIWVALIFTAALLVSTLPFSFKAMKEDPLVGLISPVFLITRTASYICGFCKGFIDYHRGERRVKKSAAK